MTVFRKIILQYKGSRWINEVLAKIVSNQITQSKVKRDKPINKFDRDKVVAKTVLWCSDSNKTIYNPAILTESLMFQ